tara:strand:+ start:322 stop:522 length:201 start_codon:yes stop_codon:yes gene_type:complete
METAASPEEVRKFIRKMYTCGWSYADDTITIVCDDEEFIIAVNKLDKEEMLMLKRVLAAIEEDPVI